MNTIPVTGQTKDAGFQIGIRKTVAALPESTWHFLFSEEGVALWLGEINWSEFEANKTFRTTDGVEGRIKVFKPISHIRLTWKKEGWPNFSTLQIRVIGAGQKTIVSFHQERLLDATQRAEMKTHWSLVIQKILHKLVL